MHCKPRAYYGFLTTPFCPAKLAEVILGLIICVNTVRWKEPKTDGFHKAGSCPAAGSDRLFNLCAAVVLAGEVDLYNGLSQAAIVVVLEPWGAILLVIGGNSESRC